MRAGPLPGSIIAVFFSHMWSGVTTDTTQMAEDTCGHDDLNQKHLKTKLWFKH